jgi:hypothetical protein
MNIKSILEGKEGKVKTKIISGILTLTVLGLLLLSGPVNAFQIILNNFDSNGYDRGSYVSTIAQVKITSDERINPELMTFNLTIGGVTRCSFYADGTEIAGCNDKNITIELLNNSQSYEYGYGYQPDYEYGYGYNYGDEAYGYGYGDYGYYQGYNNGNFVYNITFDTSRLSIGNNSIRLETSLGSGHTYRSGEETLEVKEKTDGTERLASNGEEQINDSNITKIIFDEGSSVVRNITITSDVLGDQTITLDMGALLRDGKVNVSNGIRLERQTGSTKYIAELPVGTIITGPSGWDGTMVLPKIVTQTSDYGKVNVAVDMGSSLGNLTFDNPVKITLGDMTGKRAFYVLPGDSTQHKITECSSLHSDITTDSAGSLSISDGECSISGNIDLYIWTYHFTTFAAYTPRSRGGSSTPATTVTNNQTTTTTPTGDVVTNPTTGSNTNTNANPTSGTGTTTTNQESNKALTTALIVGAISLVVLGLAYQFFLKKKKK